MKITKKLVAALFCVVLAIALCIPALTACNPNKNKNSEKTLIVGTTTVITSLNRLDAGSGGNPGYNYDVLSGTVSQLAPVAKNTDGTFKPLLTTYEETDGGRSWVFTVRDGFTWHDGVAVNADDLVFTFSDFFGYPDDENGTLSNIEKLSDRAVKLTLATPNPRFLNSIIAMRVMPKHLLEGKTAKTLSDADSVVGCGPFKFSSFDTNSGTLTFVKYGDYPYADQIAFDKVIFKTYGTADVMHLALKSGEIDMEYNYAKGLDPAAEKDFAGYKGLTLDSYADESYPMNLFFNNAVVTDPNVRKAVALAIDYAQIRKLFGTSFASASYEGFASPATIGYTETAERTRNLDASRELLLGAGYTQSDKFAFELLVRADGNYGEVAKVLKTQLEETGLISVSVKSQESQTFLSTVMEHKHQACLVKLTAYGVGNQGGLGSMYFVATGNAPYANITDPDFLRIVNGLKTAATEEEYLSAARDFQMYCAEFTPAISLYNDSVVQVYSSALSGFRKDGSFGLLNIIGWQTLRKA